MSNIVQMKIPKTTSSFMPTRSRFSNCNLASCSPLGEFADLHKKPLALQPPLIQAKLTVNQPHDEYEQEANQMADQVMRMPEPTLQHKAEPEEEDEKEIQTKPIANRITLPVQRQINSQQVSTSPKSYTDEEWHDIHQNSSDRALSPRVDGGFQNALKDEEGGGRSLSSAARAFFEPRFGLSFKQLRIHDGPRADALSRKISARAFTHGKHIYFAKGQYDAHSAEGRRLMAHELIHTLQQNAPGPGVKMRPVHAIAHRPKSALISRWEDVPTRGRRMPPITAEGDAWRRVVRLTRQNPNMQYRFVRRTIQGEREGDYINVFVVQQRPRPPVCGGRRSTEVWGSSIASIDINLGNLSSGLRISWNPRTPLTDALPREFRISPGAGLCSTWCNNINASRRPGSLCTPKGNWRVGGKSQGSNCALGGHPGATNATYIACGRSGIAIHTGNLTQCGGPASHGCVRTTPQGSAIVYDNSRRGRPIRIHGRWNGRCCYDHEDDENPRPRRGRERGPQILIPVNPPRPTNPQGDLVS